MKPVFEKKLSKAVFRTYFTRPSQNLYSVTQVHSSDVVEIGAFDFGRQVNADGMATSLSNISLAIKTADCLPIAIEGENGHALIHAGWRGLHGQILQHNLIKKLGPRAFFIGPSIGPCCYRVGREFETFFPHSQALRALGDTYTFDLVAEAKRQIECLYSDCTVEDCQICTCCTANFHSYRQNKTTDRNWNTLAIFDV